MKLIPEFIWPEFVNMRGVDIPVRGMPFSSGNKWCLVRGIYEQPECMQLDFLAKGMRVIEFGSSLGILSAIVSEIIGPEGQLISVEASPELVKIQESWLLPRRHNIKVINGFAFPLINIPHTLKVSGFDSSGGSLCGRVLIADEGDDQIIPIHSISSVASFFEGHSADCLICDIEGSEQVVLTHGLVLPASISHLLIELHPWLYEDNATLSKIISAIEADGFELISKQATTYYFHRERNMLSSFE